MLCNSWKDPTWTDVKLIRAGIDGDEKETRERVFGKNMIDIKQKTIPQLLVDEVCFYLFQLHGMVTNKLPRHFTHFTFSKLPVSCFGLLTSITTTLHAFSLSLSLA